MLEQVTRWPSGEGDGLLIHCALHAWVRIPPSSGPWGPPTHGGGFWCSVWSASPCRSPFCSLALNPRLPLHCCSHSPSAPSCSGTCAALLCDVLGPTLPRRAPSPLCSWPPSCQPAVSSPGGKAPKHGQGRPATGWPCWPGAPRALGAFFPPLLLCQPICSFPHLTCEPWASLLCQTGAEKPTLGNAVPR